MVNDLSHALLTVGTGSTCYDRALQRATVLRVGHYTTCTRASRRRRRRAAASDAARVGVDVGGNDAQGDFTPAGCPTVATRNAAVVVVHGAASIAAFTRLGLYNTAALTAGFRLGTGGRGAPRQAAARLGARVADAWTEDHTVGPPV